MSLARVRATALVLLGAALVLALIPFDPSWGVLLLRTEALRDASLHGERLPPGMLGYLLMGLGISVGLLDAARPKRRLRYRLVNVLQWSLLGIVAGRFVHLITSAGLASEALRDGTMSIATRLFLLSSSERAQGTHLLSAVQLLWVLALVRTAVGWFTASASFRRRGLLTLDVGLGAGVLVALLAPTWLPELARFCIAIVFCMRLALRAVGPMLALTERIGFRFAVAARQLRSIKRGFLATIGLLAILAIALSSTSLVTTLSVMGGFRKDLKDKIVGLSAHITLDQEGALLRDWEDLRERVAAAPGVIGVTPIVSGDVMLSGPTNLAGAQLRGIDQATARSVTQLASQFRDGAFEDLFVEPDKVPAKGSGREAGQGRLQPVALGAELATILRLSTGDTVEIVSPFGTLGPSGPMPKTSRFRVAAIVYSGMYEFDAKFVYASLPTAARFLGHEGGISALTVSTPSIDDTTRVANRLRAALAADYPDVRIRDWRSMNQNLFGALALEKLAMFITLGLAILVAGFCVFGTLSLLVREKRREIAILSTLGAETRQVVGIFLVQGFILGVLGAAMGLALGFSVTFVAERYGVRLNPEVYYIDRLPIFIDITEFAFVGAASVLVCVAATVLPALSAGRLVPADALRYE